MTRGGRTTQKNTILAATPSEDFGAICLNKPSLEPPKTCVAFSPQTKVPGSEMPGPKRPSKPPKVTKSLVGENVKTVKTVKYVKIVKLKNPAKRQMRQKRQNRKRQNRQNRQMSKKPKMSKFSQNAKISKISKKNSLNFEIATRLNGPKPGRPPLQLCSPCEHMFPGFATSARWWGAWSFQERPARNPFTRILRPWG